MSAGAAPAEAAGPCLSGVGWALAQALRHYAAWAVELAIGGALATACVALLAQPLASGLMGDGGVGAAVLWLLISGTTVAVLRGHDPLRRAQSWTEAGSQLRSLGRRQPLACALVLAVSVAGTVDAAGVATPQLAQQLLQLLPPLLAVNLAGAAAGALLLAGTHLGAGATKAGAPTSRRGVAVGMAAPIGCGLCAPALATLGPRGLLPLPLLAAAALSIGTGALAAASHRRPDRLRGLRPWHAAAAAGAATGAAAAAGPGLVLAGGLLGAVAGTGLEVGLRLARAGAVLWRHRRRLPLPPGEVVYQLDGREMEITLESTAPQGRGRLAAPGEGPVTDDGWSVIQLSASCWEGSKGRAHLIGGRRSDLLGVIRVLHPEAPGDRGR